MVQPQSGCSVSWIFSNVIILPDYPCYVRVDSVSTLLLMKLPSIIM